MDFLTTLAPLALMVGLSGKAALVVPDSYIDAHEGQLDAELEETLTSEMEVEVLKESDATLPVLRSFDFIVVAAEEGADTISVQKGLEAKAESFEVVESVAHTIALEFSNALMVYELAGGIPPGSPEDAGKAIECEEPEELPPPPVKRWFGSPVFQGVGLAVGTAAMVGGGIALGLNGQCLEGGLEKVECGEGQRPVESEFTGKFMLWAGGVTAGVFLLGLIIDGARTRSAKKKKKP